MIYLTTLNKVEQLFYYIAISQLFFVTINHIATLFRKLEYREIVN